MYAVTSGLNSVILLDTTLRLNLITLLLYVERRRITDIETLVQGSLVAQGNR